MLVQCGELCMAQKYVISLHDGAHLHSAAPLRE